MAAVRVNMLSGATVLHLGPDSLPPDATVAVLRAKVAEQRGCPRAQVVLVQSTEKLQDCDALAPLHAACVDLEITAMVQQEAYDPDRDDEEQLPALECLLCQLDGTACCRLAALAHRQKLQKILTAEGLRAAVVLLDAKDSGVSDAALRVVANAFGVRAEFREQWEDLSSREWRWVPEATPVEAEELAVRDLLLSAGALRALPAVWCRLQREDKCWNDEQRLDLDHLLFCLLRGSPAPEDVAPAMPLLMELFTCISMWREPWREWDDPVRCRNHWNAHVGIHCARQLCCCEGHVALLLDARLLPHLGHQLTGHHTWHFRALRLLHGLVAHGSEEHRDRIVSAGWLPFLLEPLPLNRMGREVRRAYCLHIAAGLADAVGRAAAARPSQGRFLRLCELLRRLVAGEGGGELKHIHLRAALPRLLPALAGYKPSCLRPSRRRKAAEAVQAVLMAGEEYWVLVEAVGFDEQVLEEARSRLRGLQSGATE